MSSFEIIIWRFEFSYSNEIRVFEIIINFTFPDVDERNENIIEQCAYEAAYVAGGVVRDNVSHCKESCMTSIEKAAVLASKKAEKTFYNCLRQFGVNDEMIRVYGVNVYVRESII